MKKGTVRQSQVSCQSTQQYFINTNDPDEAHSNLYYVADNSTSDLFKTLTKKSHRLTAIFSFKK